MADSRPFNVKFYKPQKAHLHILKDVYVQYEINPPIGFRDQKSHLQYPPKGCVCAK